MVKKGVNVNKRIEKIIEDERKVVFRKSAEIKLPKNPTLQQVIDRLEWAKKNGIPVNARVGTPGNGMFGSSFWPLSTLSLQYGEVKEK